MMRTHIYYRTDKQIQVYIRFISVDESRLSPRIKVLFFINDVSYFSGQKDSWQSASFKLHNIYEDKHESYWLDSFQLQSSNYWCSTHLWEHLRDFQIRSNFSALIFVIYFTERSSKVRLSRPLMKANVCNLTFYPTFYFLWCWTKLSFLVLTGNTTTVLQHLRFSATATLAVWNVTGIENHQLNRVVNVVIECVLEKAPSPPFKVLISPVPSKYSPMSYFCPRAGIACTWTTLSL